MNSLQELNIIMVAPRGVGKTSLLAAIHEEFDKTFESAGLTTWTSDSRTLDAIVECKRMLRNMDYRLQKRVVQTSALLDPWEDEGFVFEVGSGGKKFMKVRFTDPSGEYFKPAASLDQKEYIKQQLNQCDAVIIPIDATALMEKKIGRTKSTEISPWHEQKNDPARITKLLKDAYESLTKPRLVVLAPLKCESYMKTDKDANDLLDHIKIGYRELLEFVKEDEQYHKVAVVVTPVQTIGHITFSHAETIDGYTQFFYNKVPLDAPYAPKDGDQPLRYVLRFLLNVYNESRKLELETARKNIEQLEKEVGVKADQLNSARRRLHLAEQRVNQRNQLWLPIRLIANIFDDVHTSYSGANNSYTEKESDLKDTENQKFAVQGQVDATAAQIQAFNTAISKFAIDCKQDRGFAILQGRAKWLPVPK
ncbi:hypothetical protein NIES37_00420 [Tolypothrix tenuis PCC 7101]|uniref:Double-GTPase 2 domain-containing protein n=1 Tax=Tolypothrix tenuis PCC 7101 TaxID=231146 RepID=A0A1Z4MRN1_9CYAN|nr:hypothetical protein [Aulosira sp. FACHB-113]BAY96116.1 hypothetical protein NIES37_00420 [Tolypothrix tenuis PCC 7101]BAZ73377.1 hypothetical protein NIES50_19420 [Aulosira laxa NIES-50]